MRQVLQGKALSVEDAVDVLTLKNDEGVENYATALHLLAHAEVSHAFMTGFHEIEDYYHKDIPDTRRISSFRRVWCRIYNKDEYVPISALLAFTLMATSAGTPSAKLPTLPTPNSPPDSAQPRSI